MNKLDHIFAKDPAQFSRSYLEYVCEVLRAIDVDEIAAFVHTLLEARARGAAIYFIGNGGSAATAAHFANDLAVGTPCAFLITPLTLNVAKASGWSPGPAATFLPVFVTLMAPEPLF